MSDLISRKALCDDLREYKVHPVPISSDESEVKGYNDGIDLAISVIAEFPSAESVRKWIPVTEALPEEKGEYLVSYHPCHWNTVSEKVVVGMDTFRGKTTWAKRKYQKVIAWMPLPEPWKGE